MAEAKKADEKKPAAAKKVSTKDAVAKPVTKQAVKKDAKPKKRRIKAPGFIRAIGGYFAGAWREIRQVRWPDRKATWSLTFAVLLFTAFWTTVVLSLDLLFQYVLNNLILK